mgnify:CR=1 FL=1
MLRHFITIFLTATFLITACGPMTLGRRFKVNPSTDVKIGHDQRKDVLMKLGHPIRKATDTQGREIFTYLWANGEGAGKKCIIAFNKNGVVSVVEVSP